MNCTQTYDFGLYLRLSRDDNTGDPESTSIVNQKQMLTSYVEERGWNVKEIYIDDGMSGVTFERPSFMRMIQDIENKHINAVITKDLSRLGRNYVLSGQYTEFFFPKHNIRYIAVNDNYDSINTNNDMAPFKNVFNEWYAKDISNKIRSAKHTIAKQGKFMGSTPPYGYVKSKENKHLLVIDDYSAKMVQRIFKAFANGDSGRHIGELLNAEKVLCPRDYFYSIHGKNNPY